MKLTAQWVTGFVDGEGCFHVGYNTKSKQVLPEFCVVQSTKNIQVLHALKRWFQCGVIRGLGPNTYMYRVRNHKHLYTIILPFFLAHPCKTRKNVDYRKFRWVVNAMAHHGAHKNDEGVAAILAVKATMNTKDRTNTASHHRHASLMRTL